MYILDFGANWCSSGERRTLWSRPMATERQVWTMAVLWWELFLVVAAPSWSPFPMEGRHGVAKEKKKAGVYPSLQSGSSESSPLCVLGWAHVRQGTIRLLFLWGKQWHPVAIIYGRKYLMFLEETGCGGVRKKGRPDFTPCPIYFRSPGGRDRASVVQSKQFLYTLCQECWGHGDSRPLQFWPWGWWRSSFSVGETDHCGVFHHGLPAYHTFWCSLGTFAHMLFSDAYCLNLHTGY